MHEGRDRTNQHGKTVPNRRTRTHVIQHKPVVHHSAHARRRRAVSRNGILIITLVLIVGCGASYGWLTRVNNEAKASEAANQAKTDAVNARYDQLVDRLSREEAYRVYGLNAAKTAIASGALPAASTVTLADTSLHRNPAALDAIVNKQHPIYPLTFEPTITTIGCSDGHMMPVATDAAAAFTALCDAATAAGHPLTITSGYRSYANQLSTYRYWVSTEGQAEAETSSAYPGYSEHQLGLTADFGVPGGAALTNFCGTATQQWLSQHAADYGFVQRYTEANSYVTGYVPECWHYRYLGKETTTAFVASNADSLEKFWNISGGTYDSRVWAK